MPKTTAAPPRRPIMPQVLLVAMLAACSSSSQVAATEPPAISDTERAVAMLDLAQILSKPNSAADAHWKAALVRSYEKAYGPIDVVPAAWDAVVRRTLTCDALNDPRCVATSLTALDRLGGTGAVPMHALAEVSQFNATLPSIERRIEGARKRLNEFTSPALPRPVTALGATEPRVDRELESGSQVPRANYDRHAFAPANNPLADNLPIVLGLGAIALLLGGGGIAYGAATSAAQRRWAAAEADRAMTVARLTEEARNAQLQRERAEREVIEAQARIMQQQSVADRSAAHAPGHVATVGTVIHDQGPSGSLSHDPVRTEDTEQPAAAQIPDDPRFAPARRLFDALHRAERDVEPFLAMMDELGNTQPLKNHIHVIASWHAAVKKARNDVEAAFARMGWPREMPATTEPTSPAEAMKRLIEHAAYLTAVLAEQKKEESAVYHWSRQVPAAALQLFWPLRTLQHQRLLKHEPVSVIAYDSWTDAPKPAAPAIRVPSSPKPEPKAPAVETTTVKRDHESIHRDALLAAIGTR